MKAIWNNVVVAESDATVVVEGNHYFPVTSINAEYFAHSDTHTVCPWKGTANYYTIDVGEGATNTDGAWYYPTPKAAAAEILDHVAFWRGVRVEA